MIETCPNGYVSRRGDIPGWGSDLGRRLRLSRLECAIKCNEIRDCLSFEQSESKNLCNLNRIAEPTKGSDQDFVACVKQLGMHLIQFRNFRVMSLNYSFS